MKFLSELEEHADVKSFLDQLKAFPEIQSVELLPSKKQDRSGKKLPKASLLQKKEEKKSNIIFGTLKGKIVVALDCWGHYH